MKNIILVLSALFASFVFPVSFSRNPPAGDDPFQAVWPASCRPVELFHHWLNGKRILAIGDSNVAEFIDIYSKLLPEWGYLSKDGIHVMPEGQKAIANAICNSLNDQNK